MAPHGPLLVSHWDDVRHVAAGDARGFVSKVTDPKTGQRVIHNLPGTPYDCDIPELKLAAAAVMRGPATYLSKDQAHSMLRQLHETATHRGWRLLAAAVMRNHAHLVVGVPGDPKPKTILAAFKSYASRKLNGQCSTPQNGTWWTRAGSKRKLKDEDAVLAAIQYVRNQHRPLALWIPPQFDSRGGNCVGDESKETREPRT